MGCRLGGRTVEGVVADISLAKGTNEINSGVGDTTSSSVKKVKDQRRHDLKRKKKTNYRVSNM